MAKTNIKMVMKWQFLAFSTERAQKCYYKSQAWKSVPCKHISLTLQNDFCMHITHLQTCRLCKCFFYTTISTKEGRLHSPIGFACLLRILDYAPVCTEFPWIPSLLTYFSNSFLNQKLAIQTNLSKHSNVMNNCSYTFISSKVRLLGSIIIFRQKYWEFAHSVCAKAAAL